MPAPVEQDARGIVAPEAGLTRFRLDRDAPSPRTARFVDRYWLVTWDLRGQPSHTQHVFAHPAVNISVESWGPALVNGVTTQMGTRTLMGTGWAFGAMFRPAGFRPLLGRSMSSITDQVLPLESIVETDLAHAVGRAAPDLPAMAAAVDEILAELLPADEQASEATTALVERVAVDPAVVRVEALAAEAGCTSRQLQRRFADHVGLSPKAVVCRYRLYEAAERARGGDRVDWAAVAAELGYTDQAHLSRDFTASFGLPPGRYVALNRAPGDQAGHRSARRR
jgi:AraC-like DNA-binding protein